MHKIYNIIFFLIPFPFVLIQYRALSEWIQVFYYLKHIIILFLLIFVIFEILKLNISRLSTIKLKYFIVISIFVTYLIMNSFLFSSIKIKYILYLISIFLMFFFAININLLGNSLKKFKYLYSGLFFVLSVSIFFSFFQSEPLYSNWGVFGQDRIRWLFGFFHPGYLASYFLVLAVLAIVLWKEQYLNTFSMLITLLYAFIIIFLTDTRNSLIPLTFFVLYSSTDLSRKTLKILSLAIIPIAIIYIATLDLNNLNQLSSNRFSIWATHLVYNAKVFSWLVGTGIGNAERINFVRNYDVENVDSGIFHVDNFYFEIFLQFGLIGVTLLIILLINFFLSINKKMNHFFIMQALIIVVAFYGFFDSGLISTGNLVPLTIWALFFQLIYIKKKEGQKCKSL
jgi:hypothetical protein